LFARISLIFWISWSSILNANCNKYLFFDLQVKEKNQVPVIVLALIGRGQFLVEPFLAH
jgi:hypothetical protein